MARVVVVGGGIAGLAAAYTLAKRAPEHSVLLVERERRLGGKIGSSRVEGFLVEEGPESFLTRKSAAVELCRELGIDGSLIGRSERGHGSFIFQAGRLYPLPEGFSGLVPSDPAALESTELLSEAGKRRVLEEPGVPPSREGGTEESVAEFMARRYGEEAFDRMIEPLLCGIFAGDARSLSMEACFPQLVERERRRGSLGGEAPRAASATPLPPFASFPDGMGVLSAALEGALPGGRLLRGSGVREIRSRASGFSLLSEAGEVMEADAVILALPPGEIARLLAHLSPPLAEAHAGIPAASTVVIHLGFRSEEAGELDGYGYIVPSAEERFIHACTWLSSKWAGRAPEGFALLRLYGGRYGGEDPARLSDEELYAAAIAETRKVLGIERPPVMRHLVRWPQGIPQYNLGHRGRLAAISDALGELPGLFLAGAAYRGVGVPDCIESGRGAAGAAADYLRRR